MNKRDADEHLPIDALPAVAVMGHLNGVPENPTVSAVTAAVANVPVGASAIEAADAAADEAAGEGAGAGAVAEANDVLVRLAAALRRSLPAWSGTPLVTLPDAGLAHTHVRLVGRGVLARIPKQSQIGVAAIENLAHQVACFERNARSGHTPTLQATLPPSPELPRGALIVDEIAGRPTALPGDLPAIAAALAAIHRLPLPPAARRPPLADPPDALGALRDEIEAQAVHLAGAALAPRVRHAIDAERDALRALCADAARPTGCLIAFDAHPGNFIVDGRGKAVLVDLEKCRYGPPALDLAHATLYTSTTWDVACAATLSVEEVLRFYDHWAAACGPRAAAERAGWLPLRRAMWLWSITWCAKWRALSGRAPAASASGEDWSSANSDAALIAHVRNRVDHYLSEAGVDRVQGEFAALAQAWTPPTAAVASLQTARKLPPPAAADAAPQLVRNLSPTRADAGSPAMARAESGSTAVTGSPPPAGTGSPPAQGAESGSVAAPGSPSTARAGSRPMADDGPPPSARR